VKIERVVVDHRVMGGVPCIRGTRIPVTTVVAMLGDGMTVAEIISNYPQITDEDVRDAIHRGSTSCRH
jgi:uncharacterized protein (DUF433 family)